MPSNDIKCRSFNKDCNASVACYHNFVQIGTCLTNRVWLRHVGSYQKNVNAALGKIRQVKHIRPCLYDASVKSDAPRPKSKVTQGLVLGPLLCLVFINEIALVIRSLWLNLVKCRLKWTWRNHVTGLSTAASLRLGNGKIEIKAQRLILEFLKDGRHLPRNFFTNGLVSHALGAGTLVLHIIERNFSNLEWTSHN